MNSDWSSFPPSDWTTEASDRTILSEIQADINKGKINTDSGLKMGAIDVSHEGRHESFPQMIKK